MCVWVWGVWVCVCEGEREMCKGVFVWVYVEGWDVCGEWGLCTSANKYVERVF